MRGGRRDEREEGGRREEGRGEKEVRKELTNLLIMECTSTYAINFPPKLSIVKYLYQTSHNSSYKHLIVS